MQLHRRRTCVDSVAEDAVLGHLSANDAGDRGSRVRAKAHPQRLVGSMRDAKLLRELDERERNVTYDSSVLLTVPLWNA